MLRWESAAATSGRLRLLCYEAAMLLARTRRFGALRWWRLLAATRRHTRHSTLSRALLLWLPRVIDSRRTSVLSNRASAHALALRLRTWWRALPLCKIRLRLGKLSAAQGVLCLLRRLWMRWQQEAATAHRLATQGSSGAESR